MIHYRLARTVDASKDLTACGGLDQLLKTLGTWNRLEALEQATTKDPLKVTCRRCRKSNAFRRATTRN